MRRNFRQWIAEQWRTDPAYAYLHAAAEPLVNQFSTAGLHMGCAGTGEGDGLQGALSLLSKSVRNA